MLNRPGRQKQRALKRRVVENMQDGRKEGDFGLQTEEDDDQPQLAHG